MLHTIFLLYFIILVLILYTSLLLSLLIRLDSITILIQLWFSLFSYYFLFSDFSDKQNFSHIASSSLNFSNCWAHLSFSTCFLIVLFRGNELLTSCLLFFMFSSPSCGLPNCVIYLFFFLGKWAVQTIWMYIFIIVRGRSLKPVFITSLVCHNILWSIYTGLIL